MQCQTKDWPTHKSECKRQNYILKVILLPRFITNPSISRTLSCPATATFADLHQTLLVAFGWANTHLYDFDVFDHNDVRGRQNRLAGPEPILKITDLKTVEEGIFPGPPNQDSSKIKLYSVLDNPKIKGNTIHYNYDFGDGWEHVITCAGRTGPTAHFICLEGEGHGCAEDVGGPHGWKTLLEAYDADNPTENQKELIDWFETYASNKEPEGLRGEKKWKWDKDGINTVLTELGALPKDRDGPETSRTSILLVSLDRQPFFDNMYSEVLAKLRSKVTMTEVTHIASALHHLSQAEKLYNAVVVTDPSVMEPDMLAVQEKLVDYVQDGGTVILGFLFASFAQWPDLTRFFKKTWNLDWESGDYGRETFFLNPRANHTFMSRRQPDLPHQYSMKALHLKNTKPAERIYISNSNSAQSPAVFARHGHGFLGWIGDVNTEEGHSELLLSMCGA